MITDFWSKVNIKYLFTLRFKKKIKTAFPTPPKLFYYKEYGNFVSFLDIFVAKMSWAILWGRSEELHIYEHVFIVCTLGMGIILSN